MFAKKLQSIIAVNDKLNEWKTKIKSKKDTEVAIRGVL